MIWSLTAVDMVKLTKMAYFCPLRGKIDFEDMLVVEKTSFKTFHYNRMFFLSPTFI